MNQRLFSLVCGLLLAACGSTGKNPKGHAQPADDAGGTAGTGGDSAPACATEVAPAGLVRLTFPELVVSLEGLLDVEAVSAIATALELERRSETFPPLASAREGNVITERVLQTTDLLAQRTSSYVHDHFAEVTGCAADYGCVGEFVDAFAERAFRRALTDEEQDSLGLVLASAEALGAPPEQGAEFGVYAVLESPHFLYRTEFGPPAAAATIGEIRLSDDELANAAAFFLTGGPPDTALLKAAAAHDLGSSEQLAPHVERLLASPAAQQHLQTTLSNYLGVSRVRNVVIDSSVYPEWNAGLGAAAEHEVDRLLQRTLWDAPLSELLTSRTAFVNQELAAIYGVAFPPQGTALGDDGFADVELPQQRAGLLTRAGMLVGHSRPDGPALVARSVWVDAIITCQQLPPFPDSLSMPAAVPAGASEREKSNYRLENADCRDCHVGFDAYGLALDEFDGVGRFRTTDPQGRPIDTRVVLPAVVGGASVRGGAELSQALAGEVLRSCLTLRLLQYALPSGFPTEAARCSAQALAAAERASDEQSFGELVQSIALAPAFATRKR